MDAFEIVRRRASVQRQRAALDPEADGFEVACSLALAEGYDPIPLASDDPLLQGAEAVLDRGVEAIFYRGSVEEPEAATLIAHELGHLALHGGLAWCHSQDLVGELEDADASLETSIEVGGAIHRLDSYGARERQELQANVFARELLLPRRTASHLFLGSGLGARQIADRLALPLELVRQQLCDALLLPPQVDEHEAIDDDVSTTPEDTGSLSLDPFQRAAAEHLGSPLLLEAGPGTGKTRTLVARVLFLMDRGVDPGSVLILTFSNKAAQEIVDRVSRHGRDATPSLFAGTFHAFGLEILRKHHEHLGLPSDLRVVDRADAIALLEEQLPTLGLVHHQNLYEPALELKEMLAAISRAKDELVDAAGYRALALAMSEQAQTDPERLDAERALEVARVYGVYEEALREKGWVDFGDLVMAPTLLLENEPSVRAALRLRYRHVLVDEYQDVNRAGARLLRALAGDGERLWVVGDSRQSIYRFRGASTANMRLFSRDFSRAQRLALGVSYRSVGEIVSTFQSFADCMSASQGMLPLELEAFRGEAGAPGKPVLIEAANAEKEVEAVAGRIHELVLAGVPLRDQAVLCRSNSQVERFARGLASRGLPVLHLGSLFERAEVRDLLSILSFVVDPRGGALARLAVMPEYAVEAADVRAFLDCVAGRGTEQEEGSKEKEPPAGLLALSVLRGLAKLPDEPGAIPVPDTVLERLEAALSPSGREGLIRLASDLSGISPRHSPWGILATYLFDNAASLRRPRPGSSLDEQVCEVAIRQFLGFVKGARAGGRGFPAKHLLDRIRRLVMLAEERDLRQMPSAALHLDAVRLMTLHGSKGLEFEAVHLPCLSSSGLPSRFRRPRCPPPRGLVADLDDSSDAERALHDRDVERALHDAEEECLFFVAVSRARTHLSFFRSMTAGKSRRKRSIFLGELRPEPIVLENPMGIAAGKAVPEKIWLEGREALRRTHAKDLVVYERCPRRFFYSRIFRLPGYRRDGAYQDTNNCLYELLDWMRSTEGAVDAADVQAQLNQVWERTGPTDHAFEAQYRELLDSLAQTLLEARQDLAATDIDPEEPLSLSLGGCQVELEPDLQGLSEAGHRVLRIIRTGRQGSFKAEETVHALWQQAARERFGPTGRVEVVHLADGGRTPVALTSRKLDTRLERGRSLVSELAQGQFPAHPDSVRCPRCPYFFICPTVPGGPISLRDFRAAERASRPRKGVEGSRQAGESTLGATEAENSLVSALPVKTAESD